MSAKAPVDRAAWDAAIAARATDLASRRLEQLGDKGVARRLLEVRVTAAGARSRVWLAGDRSPLRSGMQRLVQDALAADARWVLGWLLGRFPRGPIAIALPLDSERDAVTLGLVAPLNATRVALSEGPLPFPREAVAAFKAFDAATGQPRLTGCRLDAELGTAQVIAARWDLDPAMLPVLAASQGLTDVARDVTAPALHGLAEGLGRRVQRAVETRWRPDPLPSLAVEVGPVPAVRVVGLAAALFGAAAAEPLKVALRALKQPAVYRARVAVDGDGATEVAALIGPRGQPASRSW